MMLVKPFRTLGIADIAVAGGKNASLGELYNKLSPLGVKVPDGFATTADAFRLFIGENQLDGSLKAVLQTLDRTAYANLDEVSKKCRQIILAARLPQVIREAIEGSYLFLSGDGNMAVAVRSSATAEDLPEASFAGLHESYLNVSGVENVLSAVHKCFASLYTSRAIKYREEHGFAHEIIALSAGVQHMVEAGGGCSGVCFTLEPESGFRNVIHIAGVWGLGENIVQGTVTPDEFLLFKPALDINKDALLQRTPGSRELMMVTMPDGGVQNIPVPEDKRMRFVLDEAELAQLGKWALLIEKHYGKPMDIEWAKDGVTNMLYVLQARPETVHGKVDGPVATMYELKGKYPVITKGMAVGSKIAAGRARIAHTTDEAAKLQPGEILVTELTSPDWDPFLKIAGGIVTDKGGRTSHASIIAREMGVPAIVGCTDATKKIKDGMEITVSCAGGKEGVVYEGIAQWNVISLDYSKLQLPEHTDPMLIISDPAQAFRLSFLPAKGVGLLRMEFIISNAIRIHPMALVKYSELKDEATRQEIDILTAGYKNREQYFTDKLARAVATIGAAFYPREVIVRMSDFKTNEYAHLLGGKGFEPDEENPMLGFRGASRYYHPLYKDGFRLECAAMKMAREDMGLTNIRLMIPFCRTVEEGKKVIGIMEQYGLVRGENDLEIYMMAEIPANVLLAEEFAAIFDGFSIGSNDLTQLTLGIDRDSELVSPLFSERNPAAMKMISMVIRAAKKMNRKIGLCGQAPSDDPAFATFLVGEGIDSISFNPDALMKGISNIVQAEARPLPASF